MKNGFEVYHGAFTYKDKLESAKGTFFHGKPVGKWTFTQAIPVGQGTASNLFNTYGTGTIDAMVTINGQFDSTSKRTGKWTMTCKYQFTNISYQATSGEAYGEVEFFEDQVINKLYGKFTRVAPGSNNLWEVTIMADNKGVCNGTSSFKYTKNGAVVDDRQWNITGGRLTEYDPPIDKMIVTHLKNPNNCEYTNMVEKDKADKTIGGSLLDPSTDYGSFMHNILLSNAFWYPFKKYCGFPELDEPKMPTYSTYGVYNNIDNAIEQAAKNRWDDRLFCLLDSLATIKQYSNDAFWKIIQTATATSQYMTAIKILNKPGFTTKFNNMTQWTAIMHIWNNDIPKALEVLENSPEKIKAVTEELAKSKCINSVFTYNKGKSFCCPGYDDWLKATQK